ncbi:LLM class flavin-dependent oxidoreductase [Streptomyces sp. S.PB5]|uniref:LLM class flavin-dependent oxidoreductase n=1 Tax=Streptomyces sp. S.PB5 TaxID=3020844 RepID=UPI0025AFA14A|nr:LLM class flavin-dependent oxidoreductase [Streptomyces sp. S.PB5]MDN3028534.1 LLM class flavin-dependent oxidoreductase [Streptomyces sp. S.PB5]
MNPISFGVFLSPHRDNGLVIDNALAAESNGFDFAAIQDHPYVPDHLDPYVLISHLAARTGTLRFLTDVANLPLRPAPLLAKTAASLDLLSDGRFDLGVGGGRAWPQIAGLGGPAWSPAETVNAVDEAITVLRAMWDPHRTVTFRGKTYPLEGVAAGPVPAHAIRIWLGASGPRMLKLLGSRADGWIAPLATLFETKPAAQDAIDAAARAAGRNPRDVRRVIQLVGSVTDATAPVDLPLSGPNGRPLHANADQWARIVAHFVTDLRFDTVNLVPDAETPEQISRFGTDVIPAARQLVADHRRAA